MDVGSQVAVAGLLEGAVVVDVDVCPLSGDAKARPQLLSLVADVLDRGGAGALDELCKPRRISEPGDTDDGDLISKLFLYLCDRRGFSASKWSPGCPVPEDHILALEVGEVDGLSAYRGELINQRRGSGDGSIADGICRSGSRGRSRSFLSGGCTATTGAKEKKCTCSK